MPSCDRRTLNLSTDLNSRRLLEEPQLPEPSRQGGGRPKIDWAAAFAFYTALGPARSFVEVAEKFAVSDTAVRKHARAQNWAQRVRELDRQAAKEAEVRAARALEERRLRTLRTVDLARDQILERLEVGEEPARLADLPALVRLELLLEGEPTERLEQNVEVIVVGVIGAVRTAVAEVGLSVEQADQLERSISGGSERRTESSRSSAWTSRDPAGDAGVGLTERRRSRADPAWG
jgi:hypothetical protein